ncbi:MAG: hypothetical protein HQ592_05905 [Planctomycetes bacterium]|nr:hypothetical protein [Planctomycetota bacterium]
MYIGDNVEIQACVLLDAREGPIVFEDSPGVKTIVQAGSQVYGPVYVLKWIYPDPTPPRT